MSSRVLLEVLSRLVASRQEHNYLHRTCCAKEDRIAGSGRTSENVRGPKVRWHKVRFFVIHKV